MKSPVLCGEKVKACLHQANAYASPTGIRDTFKCFLHMRVIRELKTQTKKRSPGVNRSLLKLTVLTLLTSWRVVVWQSYLCLVLLPRVYFPRWFERTPPHINHWAIKQENVITNSFCDLRLLYYPICCTFFLTFKDLALSTLDFIYAVIDI